MKQLTTGQRVRVEFEGVVTGYDGMWITVKDATGIEHMIWSGFDSSLGSSLERGIIIPLSPANWPPQVGDIWEAGGFEYMIRDARNASATTRRTVGYNKGYLLVSPLDANAPTLAGRLDELLSASPVLIRRRGQS